MKKSGFTLIEMIVTIALLAFVGIVVSMNVVKVVNNQNDNKRETVVSLIEEAACAYSGLSTADCEDGCNISLEDLLNEGLIDEEINGYSLLKCNANNVSVTIDNNGLKKCVLKENYKKLDNCKVGD